MSRRRNDEMRPHPWRRRAVLTVWLLSVVGITDEAERLLESIAIELGETRISVWLVLQAIFILGLFLRFGSPVGVSSLARRGRATDITSPGSASLMLVKTYSCMSSNQ